MALFSAFTVKLPSKSVVAPTCVPFTQTVAPMRGKSVSSNTTPFMSCAETQTVMRRAKRANHPLLLIDIFNVLCILLYYF